MSCGHERTGYRSNQEAVLLSAAYQEAGSAPQCYHCEGLIAPGEVSPKGIEVHLCEERAHAKKRKCKYQAVADLVLLKTCSFRKDKPGAAERRISRGDRAGYNSYYSQDTANTSENTLGDIVNHCGLT